MPSSLSIGAVAVIIGVCVNTLREWDRRGILAPRFRTPGGHRRYHAEDVARIVSKAEPRKSRKTVAYARVSTHDQRSDLQVQAERLHLECSMRGWVDVEVISDLGSGMNYRKRGLIRSVVDYNEEDTSGIKSGHSDGREALRHGLAKLEKAGEILPVWVDRPFLWLLHYGDTKIPGYNYEAINNERIAMMPEWVREMITPAPSVEAEPSQPSF